MPAETATTHFLVAGTTGSGKTVLLNMLMGSVLPTIGKRRANGEPYDRRALVYDAKADMLSTLHGIADCRIVTLHPFDERGAAWDIAKDITTPAAALQAAILLIPEERHGASNPFFTLAAQNILRGVMLSFLQTVGEDWTLRDVVLTLRFEERLRQVLEKIPDGRAIIDQFFQAGEAFQGVRATIATKMAPFELIAAAWDRAALKVSLHDFIEGEFILVLGNDETTRTALDAMNRVLFQRLSELILAGADTLTRQTWIVLDEVREAGRLDGLSRLMTKGRSKGACVALGFQAIEGMREVYGQNIADEITGLCNNKAILRLESPTSAQWASDLFGKTEEMDRRVSVSRSRSGRWLLPVFGRSRGVTQQRLTTEAVMASQIMTLPTAGPDNGLAGYFITRSHGAYHHSMRWQHLRRQLPARAPGVTNYVERPKSDQHLREWGTADFDRLELRALRSVPADIPSRIHDTPSHEPRQLRPVRPIRNR